MALRNTKRYQLALHIHDLLDLPLNRHGDPSLGLKILNTISTSMKNALRKGEDVKIRGFGSFVIFQPKGPRRAGNNFLTQSGDRSPVPLEYMPRKHVKFIPSEQLLAMLNLGTNWDEKRAMSIWND